MFPSKTVTYSPACTLVPTYECFNLCTYCNFRADVNKSPWLTLAAAKERLSRLESKEVCEILILSGEVHPHSARRGAWFERIYELCELALSMGFLPHTNAGVLSFSEMARLKDVNVSMGLMLEQNAPELLQTVHRHAPSKVPKVRLQQLEWAGQLAIPFTTGLLLGIGETSRDWQDTLESIALIQQSWGHIQEVILQPHSPGERQSVAAPAFNPDLLLEAIAMARGILPSSITIQIPPNLLPEPEFLLDCIAAGARDLGGIVPKDEVNPDYPHLDRASLAEILATAGWELVPRLPVYPQYYRRLPLPLQRSVLTWKDKLSCLNR